MSGKRRNRGAENVGTGYTGAFSEMPMIWAIIAIVFTAILLAGAHLAVIWAAIVGVGGALVLRVFFITNENSESRASSQRVDPQPVIIPARSEFLRHHSAAIRPRTARFDQQCDEDDPAEKLAHYLGEKIEISYRDRKDKYSIKMIRPIQFKYIMSGSIPEVTAIFAYCEDESRYRTFKMEDITCISDAYDSDPIVEDYSEFFWMRRAESDFSEFSSDVRDA